jgi:large subunit ribosomal protein L5
MNEMQQVQIHKVTVNIGIGEVGDDVEKAVTLLERLTGKTPVKTESGKNAKGFGLRDGLNVGAKVTLRGEDAHRFLERAFDALEDNLHIHNFDDSGNFSFGVSEYINVPGIEYDPDIGMMGFDVAVTLERPGYRLKRRKEETRPVGASHKVTSDDAANFVQETFDTTIDGV